MISKSKRPVLIVDDQKNWRDLLAELLEGEFDVTKVSNYAEAVQHLQTRSPFHVVVSDQRLEDQDEKNEDGLRLIEHLKQRTKQTKAIIVTGYPTISAANKALGQYHGLQAYAYLEKHPPTGEFNTNEFFNLVKKAADEAERARKQNSIDIFVVMPFAEGYDPVYQYIREVVRKLGKVCKKADQKLASSSGDDIMSDIYYGIQNADVVIAELSDGKPNVLFEVGISYAWQKKVILA